MFFLLASFMMVSMAMNRLRTIKMDLPSAVAATQLKDKKKPIEVGVDASGNISVDQQRRDLAALYDLVKERVAQDAKVQVFITADPANAHGRVIRILDRIKSAGAAKVSFALDTEAKH
jgi:biopolymer transport protein ExbD